jgi:hypothetical protein
VILENNGRGVYMRDRAGEACSETCWRKPASTVDSLVLMGNPGRQCGTSSGSYLSANERPEVFTLQLFSITDSWLLPVTSLAFLQ